MGQGKKIILLLKIIKVHLRIYVVCVWEILRVDLEKNALIYRVSQKNDFFCEIIEFENRIDTYLGGGGVGRIPKIYFLLNT